MMYTFYRFWLCVLWIGKVMCFLQFKIFVASRIRSPASRDCNKLQCVLRVPCRYDRGPLTHILCSQQLDAMLITCNLNSSFEDKKCRCKQAFRVTDHCFYQVLLDFYIIDLYFQSTVVLDVQRLKDLTCILSLTLVHHAEFCRDKLPQNVIISSND